jgi:hypothetical protein
VTPSASKAKQAQVRPLCCPLCARGFPRNEARGGGGGGLCNRERRDGHNTNPTVSLRKSVSSATSCASLDKGGVIPRSLPLLLTQQQCSPLFRTPRPRAHKGPTTARLSAPCVRSSPPVLPVSSPAPRVPLPRRLRGSAGAVGSCPAALPSASPFGAAQPRGDRAKGQHTHNATHTSRQPSHTRLTLKLTIPAALVICRDHCEWRPPHCELGSSCPVRSRLPAGCWFSDFGEIGPAVSQAIGAVQRAQTPIPMASSRKKMT